jgi:D-sedoheptulose 7-phosphate isomerase
MSYAVEDTRPVTGNVDDIFLLDEIEELSGALARLKRADYLDKLTEIAAVIAAALHDGGRILFCGNGGGAAHAQHFAAELVGRQNFDRPATAGIALTVDTSALTAIGNDRGFDEVFARQVSALGRPGDVLVSLSTSGMSRSVLAAQATARKAGLLTIAFTGADGAGLADAEHLLAMPSTSPATVQELHLVCGHIVFAIVERTLFPPGSYSPGEERP